MATQPQRPISSDLEGLLASWLRSLRARNMSAATVTTYSAAAKQLIAFLAGRGVATATDVDRAAVEEWIGQLLQNRSAATANNRYRAVQQWFAWMLDEGEIEEDPTARMRPPQIPEQPVEVLATDQIRALLKGCEGRDFVSRRDAAIIRLFADTGMRLSELAGLTLDDVDLDSGTASVLGKGRRPRACPFGTKTAQALDRYLRVRAGERGARSTHRRCGCRRRAAERCSPAASPRCSNGEAWQPASPGCTLTSSGTPPCTPGWRTAAPKATRCACSAGSPARCSAGTPHPPPTSAPAKPTAASPSATASERKLDHGPQSWATAASAAASSG